MATPIRILFYTDYDDMTDQSCSEFGLSELKKLILFKTAPLCGIFTVQVRSINRHRDLVTGEIVKGANKLTKDFLDQFDEIWFFGFLPTNTLETAENELGNDEVFNLRAWMDAGGGVFVTGDHAIPDPRFPKDDKRNQIHSTYLGLGRALAHRIPRAGQLRVWEGPPTSDTGGVDLEKRDNYNTLVGPEASDLDAADYLQTDATAQQLILPSSPPHKLFWWYVTADNSIVPITKFPDHMHEGKLLVPDPLNGEWPAPYPQPEVIAIGRDNRSFKTRRVYPVVIAYDGHLVQKSEKDEGLGRIVADSSFHHYVNTNLLGFPRDSSGNPHRHSDLDQIAQYFGNLSLWLAPPEVLDSIKSDLGELFRSHPQILEVIGNDIYSLGRTALAILSNFDQLVVRQLFNIDADPKPRPIDIFLSLIFLGRVGTFEISGEERTEVIGRLVKKLHEDATLEELMEPGFLSGQSGKRRFADKLAEAFQESSVQPFLNREQDGIDQLSLTEDGNRNVPE